MDKPPKPQTIKERFVIVRQLDFGKGFKDITEYRTVEAAVAGLEKAGRTRNECRDGNFDLNELYDVKTR